MRGIELELCSLEPGSHVCLAHVTRDEKHKTVATFLRDGLRRGERCLYLADHDQHEAVCGLLHRAGLAVDSLRERQALTLRPLSDAHGPDGQFDPERPAALARALIEGAHRGGFNGFRLAGDTSSLIQADELAVDKLPRYEAGITDLVHGTRGAALCVYDRRTTPSQVLDVVLRTHPVAFLSGRLCANPFCEPASYNLGNVGQSRKIDWMINQILHAEEGQRLLHSMNDALIREAATLTARNESARQSLESLQKALEARDRLVLTLSRWLAGPLPTLAGRVEAARSDTMLGSMPDRCDRCAESLSPLQRLARGLDEATSLIEAPPVLRGEDADLVELTAAAATAVGREPGRENALIRLSGAERLPGTWDRAYLSQLLRLLLAAANDGSGNLPVEVRLDDLGTMARLRIQYRAPTPASPAPRESAGNTPGPDSVEDDLALSLWAPRELLRLMGGTLGLSTWPDGRTVFTVDLPRRLSVPVAQEPLLQ